MVTGLIEVASGLVQHCGAVNLGIRVKASEGIRVKSNNPAFLSYILAYGTTTPYRVRRRDFTTSPRAEIAAKRSILTSKTARAGSQCWVKSAPASTGAASITDSAKTTNTLREVPRAQRCPLAKPIAHFEGTYPTHTFTHIFASSSHATFMLHALIIVLATACGPHSRPYGKQLIL